jgi:hypothetical protein
MEVYKNECREIVCRFIAKRLSFAECIAALDAALAGFLPNMTGDQLPELRIEMLSNNAFVMREMELRGSPRSTRPTAASAKTA